MEGDIVISFKATAHAATFEVRDTKLPARVVVVPWSEGEAYREALVSATDDAAYIETVCALLARYIVAMPEIDGDTYPEAVESRPAWWSRNFSFTELVNFGSVIHLGRATEGKVQRLAGTPS